MNMLRKYLSIALLLSPLALKAQMPSTGYFMESSVTRHHDNPAFLEGRPYFSFLLGDINIGTSGNFGASTFIYDIDPAQNSGRKYGTFMHPEVSQQQFFDKIGSTDKRVGVDFRYNLLTVGFRAWGGTNLVQVNVRSTTDLLLPNELLRFAKAPGLQTAYEFDNWGLRNHSFAEVALGHARKINENLTLGAKAKILFGLGYADVSVDRLNLQLTDEIWSVRGQARGTLALMKTPVLADAEGKFDELGDFKGGLSGMGLGFDFGASYKLPAVPGLTLSASLTDLGFISHSDAQIFETRPDAQWSFEGFQNVYAGSKTSESKDLGDEWERISDDFENMLSLYETSKKGKTSSLATTFNLGGEYTLPAYDRLSFGLLFTQRMAGKFSRAQLMLASRIRPIKAIEVGLNTSFATTGTTFGGMLTLNAPFCQFYVAADRFVGKLSKEGIPVNSGNGHINFGLVFPFK